MNALIFKHVNGWLKGIGEILRDFSDEVTEDEMAKMALELDRIRARLAFIQNAKTGNTIAPCAGHQPACDGNCIATRGDNNETIS